MNLSLSDKNFEIGGQSYEGFPLLYDSHGRIVKPALHFSIDHLIRNARAKDLKTWATYGQHLYDFFGYLEAKGLDWDHVPPEGSGDVPPVSHYVRWCESVVGNSASYINDKMGTVERFYRWAKQVGQITELPFQELPRSVSASGREARSGPSTNLRLTEHDSFTHVLSTGQIQQLLARTTNPTHAAATHLALAAGLRAEELLTFPASRVVDCAKLHRKVRSVKVWLDPCEMSIKFDKPRMVIVSTACMNRLWQYKENTRRKLLRGRKGAEPASLLLTRYGEPFVADGLVTPMNRLGRKLGIELHPHLLRHTFATHMLASLDALKLQGKFRGSPLVTLRDLLGHTSVVATMRYVHALDAMEDIHSTAYQEEIDEVALRVIEKRD